MSTPGDGWSRYWAQGHAHSCPGSFAGHYGPGTQAFWTRWCAGLGAQDSLLELGCGNASLLAFLARQFTPGTLPAMCGIDAARLNPAQLVTRTLDAPLRDRIRVLDGTRFDALPLEVGSVSALAAQYALEYADEAASWAQIDRVLRPVARIGLVLHKRGSLPDRVARDEAEICTAVLAAGGVMERGRALAPYLAHSHTEAGRARLARDPAATAARRAFNQASASLQGLASTLAHGDYAEELLQALVQCLGGARPDDLHAVGARLDALRQAVEDHRQRLYALQAAALDAEALAGWVERLRDRRFSVAEPGIIREQEEEFAWTIQARRNES